jgi:hypothetical protein
VAATGREKKARFKKEIGKAKKIKKRTFNIHNVKIETGKGCFDDSVWWI